MHFVVPLLLLGAAGAIIPVLIHWLHRRRTQPVEWGAMQFLRQPSRAAPRRTNFEQWLLLALRMLVVAAFALTLAGPRVRTGRYIPAMESGPPADLVIVPDHSLSGGRLSGGKTVFDRCAEVATETLGRLRGSDAVSVVLAEHSPRALAAQLLEGSDHAAIEHLRNEILRQKPGLTDCSIPDAVGAAHELLETGHNARKLILILSDQQRLKWHVQDDAAWQADLTSSDVEICSVPIVPDFEFANAAVEGLSISPKIVGAARPIQIHATVRNTGTQPLHPLSARLVIDGSDVDNKPVDVLAPKSSTEVVFEMQNGIAEVGSHWATVSLGSPDALAADNQSSTAINVLRELPVLIIDGQFSEAGGLGASRFLAAAMQPNDSSLLRANIVSLTAAASENLGRYAVVVLNDCPSLPPSLRERLVEYAQSGHGLWCILGQRTAKSFVESDLAMAGLLSVPTAPIKEGTATLVVKDAASTLIAAVIGKERNPFVGSELHRWWSIRLTDPDARTLVNTADGDPLLIERRIGSAGGVFVLWTTSADGAWNNLPLMPNFVPLVIETVYHLASGRLRGLENGGMVAGQPIEWMGDDASPPGTIRVRLPDGTIASRQPTLVNGRWLLTFPQTFDPGMYRLSSSNPSIAPVNYAVNIDPHALDRNALNSDDIAWLVEHRALDRHHPTIAPGELGAVLRSPPDQVGLWGVLGGLVLALLVLETWLAARIMRRAGSSQNVGILQLAPARPAITRRSA